ncbi:macrolide ABC transporter ATP-binding protein [Nitrospira sp.]|nr:macrolide ABC transporter ATP-binding protein [Nitrospira sp.]
MTSVPDMVVLRRVGKVYHRGTVPVQALRDVDFAARPGEFVALLGPSGCGKSTLLNLVGGLDHPTGGEILLDGASTTGWTSGDWTYARRTMIGIVFQAFHLLPALTAAENIGLPLMLRGDSAGEIDRCVSAQLAMVGLEPRAAHRPSELSGGEQQRIAIARALVHRPRLLLADEPTGNLDSHTAAEIIALLKRLPKQVGCTIMLATHSRAAADQADRRCVMKDGQLVEE